MRSMSVTVKRAPAGGKPNISFMFAPSQLNLTFTTVWDQQTDKGEVWMHVVRGDAYGLEEAQFLKATGLGDICPETCVQAAPPGDALGRGFILEDPTVLTNLVNMPPRQPTCHQPHRRHLHN